MVVEVTDNNFHEEVLNSSIPVLVDFWAEWCGPCKILLPIIEELDKELFNKCKIVKMNIDSNTNIPSKFGIKSIPTLMLFKNGVVLSTKVGALPKNSIISWIEKEVI